MLFNLMKQKPTPAISTDLSELTARVRPEAAPAEMTPLPE